MLCVYLLVSVKSEFKVLLWKTYVVLNDTYFLLEGTKINFRKEG